GRSWWVTGLPAIFLCAVTLASLCLIARPWLLSLSSGTARLDPVGATAVLLIALALSFLAETARAIRRETIPPL
ncbi:MAG: hypothetical protein AAB339_06980, partial [Elusimicrobiota bacterium]